MKTAEEKVVTTTAPVEPLQDNVQNRIAGLSETLEERAKGLQAIRDELEACTGLVRDELDKVMQASLEQNKNPDEKLLAGISGRYDLSSEYGVSRDDFHIVLDEIRANEKTLAQLRRLHATGAEMTIISIDASEVLFIDTIDNVNVEAQEEFLSGLDASERSDVVKTLQQRFPEIEQLLKRADGERGLNYYDYLVICEVTGAEPMPEDKYRELQEHKPVDRQTICWLLTEQEILNRGVAVCGDRGDRGVDVYGNFADYRSYLRAGRPLLRVQRA